MWIGQRQRLHLARLEQVRGRGEHAAEDTLAGRMKIARVTFLGYDLRYAHGAYVMSGGRTVTSLPSTVVRIETDEGLVGFGETCPLGPAYLPAHAEGARAALRELAPSLLGLDPRNLNAVNDTMDAALAGHGYAKAAVDIACWDLLGQAAGLPVSTLLGGTRADDFPLYVAIPLGPIEEMVAHVARVGRRGSAASSSSSAPTRARTRPGCGPCSTPPRRAR